MSTGLAQEERGISGGSFFETSTGNQAYHLLNNPHFNERAQGQFDPIQHNSKMAVAHFLFEYFGWKMETFGQPIKRFLLFRRSCRRSSQTCFTIYILTKISGILGFLGILFLPLLVQRLLCVAGFMKTMSTSFLCTSRTKWPSDIDFITRKKLSKILSK